MFYPNLTKEDENNQGNSDGRLTEDLKIEPINYFAIQVVHLTASTTLICWHKR